MTEFWVRTHRRISWFYIQGMAILTPDRRPEANTSAHGRGGKDVIRAILVILLTTVIVAGQYTSPPSGNVIAAPWSPDWLEDGDDWPRMTDAAFGLTSGDQPIIRQLQFITSYNVKQYGATGDGLTDDAEAIQAVINACPAGGTVVFPDGVYRIASQIRRPGVDGSIHLVGMSEAAAIKPDINAFTDAVVIGSIGAGSYHSTVRNLTFFSTADNVCRDALVFTQVYFGAIVDVTAVCGHTGYAVKLNGSTGTRIERLHTGYSNAVSGYTRGANGIGLADATVQNNAVLIEDVFLNLHTGYGIYAESSLGANILHITGGAIQDCDIGYIYIKGHDHVQIDHLYFEHVTGDPNVRLEDCEYATIGPNFKMYGAGELLEMHDVDDLEITGSRLYSIDAHPLCERWSVRQTKFHGYPDGNDFTDVSGIDFPNYVRYSTRLFQPSSESPINLFYNASFETWWDHDTPVGWSGNAHTQCGVGLSDPNTKGVAHCTLVDHGGTYTATTLSHPYAPEIAERAAGQHLSVAMWMRCKPATWKNRPMFRVRVVTPNGNEDTYSTPVDVDNTWVWRHVTVPVDREAISVQVAAYGDQAWYMAGPTMTITDEAQVYSPAAPVWLDGAITWDPSPLADGMGETSAPITVTGAELQDFVLLAAPYDLQNLTATASVQSADRVVIRLQNGSGVDVDLRSGLWRVRVMKR